MTVVKNLRDLAGKSVAFSAAGNYRELIGIRIPLFLLNPKFFSEVFIMSPALKLNILDRACGANNILTH